jgi:hypothetical protein
MREPAEQSPSPDRIVLVEGSSLSDQAQLTDARGNARVLGWAFLIAGAAAVGVAADV